MIASESNVTVKNNDARLAAEVHEIVKDYMRPKSSIYWTDFTVSLVVAGTSLWLFLTQPSFSWIQIVSFFVAGFAVYRASVFTHELAHIHDHRFGPFRVAWNLFFGVPCLMPLFLYGDHKSHHVHHSYGTESDGEYYPVGLGPVLLSVSYFAHVFAIPIAAVFRFGLLTPLSLAIPPLRPLVWQKMSSLATMNPRYRRPMPRPKETTGIVIQEIGCFVWVWTVLVLVIWGVVPWTILPQMYLLFLFVTTINYVRAFGAHGYTNPGDRMTYLEQLRDSTTIPGTPLLTELWAPLGMRYHALHHLVPSLPYHCMGKAHRRLMRRLPADSPYRETIRPSLWSAIAEVLRGARAAGNRSHSASAIP